MSDGVSVKLERWRDDGQPWRARVRVTDSEFKMEGLRFSGEGDSIRLAELAALFAAEEFLKAAAAEVRRRLEELR